MHIYVVESPTKTIKIGRSKTPQSRIKQIASAAGFEPVRNWVSIPVVDAGLFERMIHAHFDNHRRVGEWFECDFDSAVTFIADSMKERKAEIDSSTWYFKARKMVSQRKLKIQDIAANLGVTPSAVGHWLSGRRQASVEEASKIAELLGVSLSDLVSDRTLDPDEIALTIALRTLTPPQRAQAVRMLEAFATSCRTAN